MCAVGSIARHSHHYMNFHRTLAIVTPAHFRNSDRRFWLGHEITRLVLKDALRVGFQVVEAVLEKNSFLEYAMYTT